jgi:hypothetical protein
MATTKITSPDLFDLGSLNTALQLPSGTTAERPTSPSTGEWRYNTTTNLIEFYDGGAWRDLQDESLFPVPSENFNTVLYTGNGSTQSITGVGFKPDFVWIKSRSGAVNNWHTLFDSTRGANKAIFSNATDAEFTYTDTLTSFDTDGFTLGADSIARSVNIGSTNYVAWCWKAKGGTTSSNTDGTITSTVQANTNAGFSIIKWTGNGASGQSIGHGLSSAPQIMIFKNLTTAQNWLVYSTVTNIGAANELDYGYLSLDYEFNRFGNSGISDPTSTVINIGTSTFDNSSGDNFIGYCLRSVTQYSKFDTYTGNGSTNGPIVNTGFEPAFLIVKRTDTTANWKMVDNKRSTSNPRQKTLFPNLGNAESDVITDRVNFLTNGFQIKNNDSSWNANGGTYIYMVFASDPSAAPVLADSFYPSTYTGNGSTQSITGVGFKPDLTWVKARSINYDHQLQDSVRGPGYGLISNQTVTENFYNTITSFDSDGFTVDASSFLGTNASGQTYVAWNWKANPVPTINTDGTIQSVASANQAAGFSIVSFTTPATNNFTVGHGLSAAPKIIIIKGTSIVSSWTVYSSEIGATNYLLLNSSNASTASSLPFNDTAPTNSVFTGGSSTVWYGTNQNYIAYCFAEVAGFSKFGSYTGDGTSNLSKSINVGFQPDFVLVRATSATGTWLLWDSARVSGGAYYGLYPNNDIAETLWNQSNEFNIVSTGFTVGRVNNNDGYDNNNNGVNYIYMAFKIN